jgi:hypothetical protein
MTIPGRMSTRCWNINVNIINFHNLVSILTHDTSYNINYMSHSLSK